MSRYMRDVITDIEDRRRQQNFMWGDVDEQESRHGHEMEMGTADIEMRRVTRELAQKITKRHMEEGKCTWADVLREEVYEVMAEDPSPENWPKLRGEIIDAAAVLVAMAEAGDMRDDAQKTTTHS